MLAPDFAAPHWVGLLELAGVLACLGLWFVLRDVGARSRAVLTVCGGVLLLLAVGRALDRAYGVAAFAGFPGFFSEDGTKHVVELALLAAGFVVGAVVASIGAGSGVEEDLAPEPAAPVALPPLPASVWSRPEVIGAGPEHDDDVVEPEPEPEPYVPPLPVSRGVAVPLLAVAVGLGLPVFGYSSALGSLGVPRSGTHVGTFGIAAHVAVGVLAGLALLGAALALDVWEERLAVAAFFGLAVGTALIASFPRTFFNEVWSFAGTGLVAGLLAPAVLAALRRVVKTDQRAVLAGALAALLLFAGSGVLATKAYFERRTDVFSSSVSD